MTTCWDARQDFSLLTLLFLILFILRSSCKQSYILILKSAYEVLSPIMVFSNTHMHVHIHTCTHTYMYTHVYAHTHAHARKHVHVHTQIHERTFKFSFPLLRHPSLSLPRPCSFLFSVFLLLVFFCPPLHSSSPRSSSHGHFLVSRPIPTPAPLHMHINNY